MEHPNHLIVVCGHGIWLGGPAKGHDESEWLIESYKTGETPTYIEHIKEGVKALSQDARSVLVFSGGPTRRETRLSEGQSYLQLAQANNYFDLLPASTPDDPISTSRVLSEDKALDSYYNILFSLVLFWRVHKNVWPQCLTIVSHGFKKRRLVDLHCGAIGFPISRVSFIGVDPPGLKLDLDGEDGNNASEETKKILAGIVKAEREWEEDPHGVSAGLAEKRRARNVWSVDQKLFVDHRERKGSGLKTWILEDGSENVVMEAERPW